MSRLSVSFIRGSIIYLLIGMSFGLIMALPGGHAWLAAIGMGLPTLAHAHAMLLGFMLMMVMGVAYHIFPRFTGNPVRQPWMAQFNLWGCHIGTAAMVLGFLFRGALPWLLPAGALVQTVGLACFAINMLQIVRPLQRIMPQMPPGARPMAGGQPPRPPCQS